jgi:hypothetical protein
MSWDITVPRIKSYVYVPGELSWTKIVDVAGVDMDAMGGNYTNWGSVLLMGGGANSQLWQGWGGPHAEWAGIALTDGRCDR